MRGDCVRGIGLDNTEVFCGVYRLQEASPLPEGAQDSGLDLNDLDEGQRLVAIIGEPKWFAVDDLWAALWLL